MKTRFENLAEVRTELLGYHDATFVSAETGIALARLARLESGDEPPTIGEAHRLSAIYGIEPRLLAERPIVLQYGDGITTLALSSEFQQVPPATRARIAAAANAARELVDLEQMAGEPNRWIQLTGELGRLKPPSARITDPYLQGRHYAAELRRRLGLNGPIASMRDLMSRHFPAITILHARLGRDCDLAGVSFADARRGPTIVLNLDGRNENPFVRRFSLAHELCHIAVDWNRMEPLAVISEHRDDVQLSIEQRANGFAIRFLCPSQSIPKPGARPARLALEHLVEHWGLHYQAAVLDLKKAGHVEQDLKGTMASHLLHGRWAEAERIEGVFDFPVDDVPLERRTRIARLAARLYLDKRLSAEAFTSRLALPRFDYTSLASVLRFFGHAEDAIESREEEERASFPLRGQPYFMSDDFNDPLPEWDDGTSW